MHIPDGYLSPSTCATLYVLAASGWYGALRRIKRVLTTRTIPLISVFAAFSFVVMMFNVPLPGGTTGHAVGVAVAAIVLGPWGSILAISIALAIQALFFGDGGITTLGANCLNMAIIGSFVAYAVYRAIAANSELISRRRVLAAAVAGYCAINASAFVTAIEFGIQPLLFHDSSGTPLYAPYSLSVAIPAMMLGHLTFAGFAEAAISAGMVSFLQKTDVGLLRGVKNLAQGPESLLPQPVSEASQKNLWWAVALLMVLTPLGILAAGTAWGEWSSADFANVHARAQIEATSGDQAPPSSVPAGLQKLSSLWTAPFPGYAPRFIKSPAVGYFLSAVFGVGFLALAALLARSVSRRKRQPEARA
jgi:cobalt/nickel transport system permease protein